ncbi:MAG: DUF559 domain-containing protein [Nitrospirae bacterium]|nr:DUF559 domain-containing protein [Nitrospirota bacterium]
MELITDLRKAIDEGLRRSFHWLKPAVIDVLADNDQPLRRLYEITCNRMDGLAEKAQIVDDYQIKLPDIDKAQISADANDLLQYLKSGKKIYLWPFQPKIIRKTKYLWHETYIDGRPCDNINSLEKILDFLDADKRLNQICFDWSNKITKADGSFVSQVALITEQLKALESVLAIDNPLQECKRAINELSIISEPKWHETNELIELEKRFKAALVFESEKGISNKFKNIKDIIDHYVNLNNSNNINLEFNNSLKSRDLKSWSTAYYKLQELEARYKLLSERNLLYQTLNEQLPEVANKLRSNYQDSIWDQRGNQFTDAWKWSLADTWLQDYEAKHDSEKLNASFVLLQQRISNTTAKLAAKKAWAHCLNPMKNEQRVTLEAWESAVRRIGAGNRVGSAQARRDAEQHMNECRKIVPAWIMPLYRVLDTVSMEPEIFDLVVVDEASQCGPEALFVHYLAKKVIIVGDKEQVAPENIGTRESDVQELRNRYLDNVPISDSLGRDSTLFDNAMRLKEKVFLREHFRCMPEIIHFCNELCYRPIGKELIPLRQYGPDRLEPPVITEYIESGNRDVAARGSLMKTNLPEANKIVERLIECCNDPKYVNKTMGVISMLGDDQAKLIEGMLMKKLTPVEYEKRKLLCGTSASFQGDERDVIFISMVDAPPSQFRAVTGDTDKRRFNVAVSRAKDQLWLFHSFQLSDLNSICFRHRLLRYCKNPRPGIESGGIEKCESQFERDVYQKLTFRGYSVIPQVEIAGKFIDLVVQGMRARLAVECDGDEWHGPDRWEEDMNRQRTLERCGWTFWRVRGFEFYRNPDEALSALWDRLDDMQIYPHGGDRSQFSARDNAEEQTEKETDIDIEDLDDETEIKHNISDIGQANLFNASINSVRDLNKKVIRDIVIHLLKENSRGKDLLPTAVIRRSGLSVRGNNRSKIVNRINRVVRDMIRDGAIQQYNTQKRVRFKLPV